MSYRCDVCREVVAPHKPRLTHPLMKPGGKQITQELACCKTCHTMLGAGMSLAVVIRERGKGVTLEPPTGVVPKLKLKRVELRGKVVTLWRAKQGLV